MKQNNEDDEGENKLNYDVQMRLIRIQNSFLWNLESDRNITLSRSIINSSRRKTVVRKSSETWDIQ